jgi:hypothetical protein
LGTHAEAFTSGKHVGYEETALEGLTLSLATMNEKRIKCVINGGSHNARGLAEVVHDMVRIREISPERDRSKTLQIKQNNYNLKVGYVLGDNLLSRIHELIDPNNGAVHLDSETKEITLAKNTYGFLDDTKKIVSAHAYLGARAIKRGLDEGCDIIICKLPVDLIWLC